MDDWNLPTSVQRWLSLSKVVEQGLGRPIPSAIYDISAQHNQCRSENWRRPKWAQVEIGKEKNEPTWLYLALIKKNSCAKLIALRLMVNRYIGNMIVFLRCHYAYLSITITSKLSALNHNKILYYCNCHATISSSIHMFAIFLVSCENKLRHYKRSCDLRCITPGNVQCRLCENATLLAIKQLHKITFY